MIPRITPQNEAQDRRIVSYVHWTGEESPGVRTPVNPVWGMVEIVVFALGFQLWLWGAGLYVQGNSLLVWAFWALFTAAGTWLLWLSPIRWHCDPPALRGWAFPGESRDDPGAFRQAWPTYALAILAGGAMLMGIGRYYSPATLARLNWETFAIRLLGYLLFGPVQSLVFFGFIQTRLHALILQAQANGSAVHHRLSVVTGTACLFSLAHVPNVPLMAVSLMAGLALSWIYYARPNLMLMGLAHALLGTMLHQFTGMFMRIGPFYHHPDYHVIRVVVPGLAALIGKHF